MLIAPYYVVLSFPRVEGNTDLRSFETVCVAAGAYAYGRYGIGDGNTAEATGKRLFVCVGMCEGAFAENLAGFVVEHLPEICVVIPSGIRVSNGNGEVPAPIAVFLHFDSPDLCKVQTLSVA